MIPREYRIFVWLPPAVAVNCVGITFLDPLRQHLPMLAFFYGSLFAQATLTAAWLTLGPLRFVYRAPLALTWLLLLVMVISILTARGIPHAEALFQLSLAAAWIAAVIVLVLARLFYGITLRHRDEAQHEASKFQFSIARLLTMICIVAVLLGLGKAILPALNEYFGPHMLTFFAVIGISGATVALPIVFSVLSQHLVTVRVVSSLVALALASWLESLWMSPRGLSIDEIAAINLGTLAITLSYVATIRLTGYRLARSP
jgi:hypothetical protein